MDVRMGVLSHTILQYKTKEKTQDKKALKNMDAEDLYDFEWSTWTIFALILIIMSIN